MTNRFMISVRGGAIKSADWLVAGAGGAGSAGGGAAHPLSKAPVLGVARPRRLHEPRSGRIVGHEGCGTGGAKGGMNNAQSRGLSKDGTRCAVQDGMARKAWTTLSHGQHEQGRRKNAQSKDGMSKDSTAAKDQVQHHHGNAATGDRRATGREAHPDRFRDPSKIQETTNVNFNIRLARRFRFGPFPSASPRIVEIYRSGAATGHLVSGRYIVVRPQTHEIVHIIRQTADRQPA